MSVHEQGYSTSTFPSPDKIHCPSRRSHPSTSYLPLAKRSPKQQPLYVEITMNLRTRSVRAEDKITALTIPRSAKEKRTGQTRSGWERMASVSGGQPSRGGFVDWLAAERMKRRCRSNVHRCCCNRFLPILAAPALPRRAVSRQRYTTYRLYTPSQNAYVPVPSK